MQDITGEELGRVSNTAPDARLDIHARWFWEPQGAAFFDVRVCHPNADSYRDLSQIYRNHENKKKNALVCLRGFRARNYKLDLKNIDFDVANSESLT